LAIAPDAVGECSAPLVAEALHPFVFVWAVEALFEGALVAGTGSGRRKSGYVVLVLVSGCGYDWLLEGFAVVCVVAFSSGCLGERAADVLGSFSGAAPTRSSWAA
jgi:hypothetical protein